MRTDHRRGRQVLGPQPLRPARERHEGRSTAPVDVAGLTSGVTAIAVGGDPHLCPDVPGAGSNAGVRTTTVSSGMAPKPTAASPSTCRASRMASSRSSPARHHTCALTTAGGVKCWGWNAYGMLGNGKTTDSAVPVDVSGLASGITAVAARRWQSHTCALTSSGWRRVLGRRHRRQLGDGRWPGIPTQRHGERDTRRCHRADQRRHRGRRGRLQLIHVLSRARAPSSAGATTSKARLATARQPTA